MRPIQTIMKYVATAVLSVVMAVSFAQESGRIVIDVTNRPMNQVLIYLRDSYGFQVSFNDALLSKEIISLKGEFSSKDLAINALLKGRNFDVKKIDDVFVIIPHNEPASIRANKENPSLLRFTIKGSIVESGTFEPLPFSHILINDKALVSDATGSFAYTASADTSFRIRISHIGYYVLDTSITKNTDNRFSLIPATTSLSEVTVNSLGVEKSTIVGEEPGEMQLNSYIARALPNQGDNSVFNLLRLLPGILSAGEQSSDFFVWGGYEGHSRVVFDGFSVFGLKNFNDNISAINPFMVKNIDVLKGGYRANYGDQVGAIINISGKNGNMQKPSFSLNINNTTVSGMVELPMGKRSSLLLAYRQTYYNLYDSDDFNIFSPINSPESINERWNRQAMEFDIQLSPDLYNFRDGNVKYTHRFSNGDLFYVSLYAGGDKFRINGEVEKNIPTQQAPDKFSNLTVDVSSTETNNQLGGAAFFSKSFGDKVTSNITASFSSFDRDNKNSVGTFMNQSQPNEEKDDLSNSIREISLRNENQIFLGRNFRLNAGIGAQTNNVFFSQEMQFDRPSDSNFADESSLSHQINHMYGYAEGVYSKSKLLRTILGTRLILVDGQFIPEPRASIEWNPLAFLSVNASAGQYHQFVFKKTMIDHNGNYTSYWCGYEDKPLSATHVTANISIKHKDFVFTAESFFKPVDGIVRTQALQIQENQNMQQIVLQGKSRSFGIDFYAKQEIGQNTVWASYTLSKTEENLTSKLSEYSQYGTNGYVAAPHDQRHELKVAGIAKVWKLYLSANYVYGSGVELLKRFAELQDADHYYSRLDVATSYRFEVGNKLKGEAGLSIFNVTNPQNVKYSNIKSIKAANFGTYSIYTQSLPFTPLLFLHLKL